MQPTEALGRAHSWTVANWTCYTPYKNWDGKWGSLTAMISWQLRSHILTFVILPAFGSSLFFYYSYSLLKPAYQLFQDIMVFCSSHFPEEEADFADGGYMKFYSLEAAEADIGDENVRLSCVAVINWWIYSISIYRWRWLCFWHERGPSNLPVFWWL